MRRTTRTIALLVMLLAAACHSETHPDEAITRESRSEAQKPVITVPDVKEPSSALASGTRVDIFDHGLQMTRGTQVIPGDWKLTQDIATDPYSAQLVRFHLEVRGPGGELIKALGLQRYGQMVGIGFDQAVWQMTMRGLDGEIQDVSIGGLQRSATLERTPEFQKAIRLSSERGLQVQALETPFIGRRNGKELKGLVYLWHFTSPNMRAMGTLQGMAVAGPPESFEKAVRINEQIAHSYRANPHFEQRIMQVNAATMQRFNAQHEQRMAQSQAQHQQRMAANQAQFDSHQRMMQDRYNANDQQHAQWMENFRNSGTSAWSGSDYSGHDALIDGIHEQSTFVDPYSGQQVHRDGQYDTWYTNGLGEYYGTNDPSFDPNSMDGNWQRIQPLDPNR